LLCQISYHIN